MHMGIQYMVQSILDYLFGTVEDQEQAEKDFKRLQGSGA